MAARTKQRRFGTFDLSIANGISVSKWGSRLGHRAKFKAKTVAVGSSLVSDQYTDHRVAISGMVVGVDTGEAESRLGALISALTQGEQALTLYADREILARLMGDVRYSLVPSGTGTIYNFTATFVSRFPYWRAVTPLVFPSLPTGVGPHTLIVPSPSGIAPTWPLIKIENTGPAFTDKVLTFTNVSSAAYIQLIGITMGSGDSITLDMAEAFIGTQSAIPIHPFSVGGLFFSINSSAATTLQLAHNVGSGARWDIDVTYRGSFWNE